MSAAPPAEFYAWQANPRSRDLAIAKEHALKEAATARGIPTHQLHDEWTRWWADNVSAVAPTKKPQGDRLVMIRAESGGICPRCHTFIGKNAQIVRLDEAEAPWSDDRKSNWRTGGHWYSNGAEIDMQPRWWVHWRCYVDVMVEDCACVYCGSEDDITVDHIVPRRYGGTDQPRNLVPACRTCNSRKNTLPAELANTTKRQQEAWLAQRGWLRHDTGWSRGDGRVFTLPVAIRITAYGSRAVSHIGTLTEGDAE